MARLGGRRAPEPREQERGDAWRPTEHSDECARFAPEQHDAGRGGADREQRHRPPAGARVAGRVPEVADDRGRAAELRPAAADPDVEAAREDEVGEPERDAEHEHRRPGDGRLTDPLASRDQHVGGLPGQHQDAVGMRGHREQRGRDPQRPPSAAAAVERAEERERAGEREEEEEAVHPAVDAVEEEQPARCDDQRRNEPDGRAREPLSECRDEREARDREGRGEQPQTAEPEAEVGDSPGEQEVERGAAAIARHVLDHARQRVAADEEGERLVLVRRPRHQLVEQERGRGDHHADDPDERPARLQPRPRERPLGRARRALPLCLDPLRHRGFGHLRW